MVRASYAYRSKARLLLRLPSCMSHAAAHTHRHTVPDREKRRGTQKPSTETYECRHGCKFKVKVVLPCLGGNGRRGVGMVDVPSPQVVTRGVGDLVGDSK